MKHGRKSDFYSMTNVTYVIWYSDKNMVAKR